MVCTNNSERNYNEFFTNNIDEHYQKYFNNCNVI